MEFNQFKEKAFEAALKNGCDAAELYFVEGDSFSAMVDYGDGVTAMLQGMYCDHTTFCFRDLTITFLGENGYMRVERPDRIVMHTDEYRVVEIGNAEKSAFVMELEHFRDAVLGRTENTLRASDAVRMTRLIEDIRSFE